MTDTMRARRAAQEQGGTLPHTLSAGPFEVTAGDVRSAVPGRALAYGALFSAPLWMWLYLAWFVTSRVVGQ